MNASRYYSTIINNHIYGHDYHYLHEQTTYHDTCNHREYDQRYHDTGNDHDYEHEDYNQRYHHTGNGHDYEHEDYNQRCHDTSCDYEYEDYYNQRYHDTGNGHDYEHQRYNDPHGYGHHDVHHGYNQRHHDTRTNGHEYDRDDHHADDALAYSLDEVADKHGQDDDDEFWRDSDGHDNVDAWDDCSSNSTDSWKTDDLHDLDDLDADHYRDDDIDYHQDDGEDYRYQDEDYGFGMMKLSVSELSETD